MPIFVGAIILINTFATVLAFSNHFQFSMGETGLTLSISCRAFEKAVNETAHRHDI